MPWLRAGLVVTTILVACLEGGSGLPLGHPCEGDGDCAEGLVCLYGRCRSACLTDRDCDTETGELCLVSAEGVGACSLPDEGACTAGSCPAGLACGPDGRCLVACQDGGCAPGFECVAVGGEEACAPLPCTSDDRCDCDGDGDPATGACGGGDCDDLDAAVHSGAAEVCNGVDDDCDGGIDEPTPLDGAPLELAALDLGDAVVGAPTVAAAADRYGVAWALSSGAVSALEVRAPYASAADAVSAEAPGVVDVASGYSSSGGGFVLMYAAGAGALASSVICDSTCDIVSESPVLAGAFLALDLALHADVFALPRVDGESTLRVARGDLATPWEATTSEWSAPAAPDGFAVTATDAGFAMVRASPPTEEDLLELLTWSAEGLDFDLPVAIATGEASDPDVSWNAAAGRFAVVYDTAEGARLQTVAEGVVGPALEVYGNQSRAPAVAAAGVREAVALEWPGAEGEPHELKLVIVDPDGGWRVATRLLSTSRAHSPDIAAGANGFAVTWVEDGDGADEPTRVMFQAFETCP